MELHKELHWEMVNEPLSEDMIKGAELLLRVKFPDDYRECLRKYHGAYCLESDYKIQSKDGEMFGGIGVLLTVDPIEEENIFSTLYFFPKGIIPISDDGGGNYICLDYRNDPTKKNPDIVFYDHEIDVEFEYNFFYICETYTDLLNSAFIPDDVIEDRLKNNLFLPKEIIEDWKKKGGS